MQSMKKVKKGNNYVALIGDVHGKLDILGREIKKHPKTICTELGFKGQHDYFLEYFYKEGKNRVLFGNHDYYPYLNTKAHSTKNWEYIEEFDLFLIRGAWSIDWYHRKEGHTWFADEEIPYKEWEEIIDAFITHKPKYVFSHDLPQTIKEEIFFFNNKTITNQGLQACLDSWTPDFWIHGHYHTTHETLIDETIYIGLDELEVYKLYKK